MKKNKEDKFIGIFDSGFGGLNIMKDIVKRMPEYDYIYLGDTARVPYGNRSEEILYKFTKQAVDFLFKNNCEIIIFACNTVSSNALRKIQKKYLPENYSEKKVLGVIIPTAEFAIQETKNKKIGVMATSRTVKSKAFLREFIKLDSDIEVFQMACPMLVPIIESGECDSKIADIILMKYIKPLKGKKIDTLILGCTHYGILKNRIKKLVGEKIKVISESKIVSEKLKKYLKKHSEIESKLGKRRKRIFYSTDLTKNFETLGSKFYGKKIKVEKIKLV